MQGLPRTSTENLLSRPRPGADQRSSTAFRSKRPRTDCAPSPVSAASRSNRSAAVQVSRAGRLGLAAGHGREPVVQDDFHPGHLAEHGVAGGVHTGVALGALAQHREARAASSGRERTTPCRTASEAPMQTRCPWPPGSRAACCSRCRRRSRPFLLVLQFADRLGERPVGTSRAECRRAGNRLEGGRDFSVTGRPGQQPSPLADHSVRGVEALLPADAHPHPLELGLDHVQPSSKRYGGLRRLGGTFHQLQAVADKHRFQDGGLDPVARLQIPCR